jgi:two-component system, chemotaxis family, chemotaxis protein CheY
MTGSAFERLKVLVVEDNTHMRSLLHTLLASLGIRDIIEAGDGDEALILLRSKKCDLIITDLAMKPMDGLAFTHEIRTAHNSPNPFIPIVMMSGHTEKHRVQTARDAGITEFLAKPVTAQSLFARIAEIVDRPRPFVRCPDYFGPDRRRKAMEDYAGPFRRHDDFKDVVVR